MSENATKGRA